jgi:hypothetical protein
LVLVFEGGLCPKHQGADCATQPRELLYERGRPFYGSKPGVFLRRSIASVCINYCKHIRFFENETLPGKKTGIIDPGNNIFGAKIAPR